MVNVLNTDKQIAVIAALAEGSSIRAIERMTGLHRDTIMRLGVKVGQGCTRVTVLHIAPALTPATAVRAFIVSRFRNLGVRDGQA
ncbi:MAG TPA: hypothetical protein VG714_06440 [Acidobacteriaceae bacterium]|nr:hypothetical protein [Acidobacteriaceae bacterium]